MTSASGMIQLSGHTSVSRHQAIPAANDALNESGVILEDVHDYSNRMTTYRFEIALADVAGLIAALTAAGFVLDDDQPARVMAGVEPDAEGFVRATLQLTLPGEDGNRRNPNPDLG